MSIKNLLFATFILFSQIAVSNEVKLEDYKDFVKKWEQITVRYREDTGELRYVWGNKDAVLGLNDGIGKYKDNSVFAKISFISKEDELFTSSRVPSGTRRVQLMIRDPKKYKETDGWGYYLFDYNGRRVPTDEMACAGCHKLAEAKGFVFSDKVDLGDLFAPVKKPMPKTNLALLMTQFKNTTLNEIPKEYQKYIPTNKNKNISKLEKPWFPNAFEGTADELRPLLAKEVLKNGKPAFYLSPDKKVLSYVSFNQNKGQCEKDKASMHSVIAFKKDEIDGSSELKTREHTYCLNKQ